MSLVCDAGGYDTDGADVAEVAKQYGGGGHRNAAGFRVSFAQAQAFEV